MLFVSYSFNGETYGKGRLVLAVVKKYVEDNPGVTSDQIKEIFNNERIKVFAPISEAKEIADRTGRRRHFIDETIILDDGEIAVSTEWGSGNIGAFIEIAESLGYVIEPLNQTEEIREYIRAKMQDAKSQGLEHLTIVAGDIIKEKLNGNYRKTAVVCRAMSSLKQDGDEVLYSPESGYGSRLEMRYDLTIREFEPFFV